MPYPVKSSVSVLPDQTATVTFRPATAGLVKVIVTAVGIPPPPPPPAHGDGDPPPPLNLSILVALFRPGSTTPTFSESGSQRLDKPPGVRDRVVVWGDALAAATDLGADWTVQITNNGNVQANCEITMRYQVLAGNLGKIDHIVVLMMENRSFDHMLGYLRASRGDVDGLTGTERNRDDSNNSYYVHLLSSTYFKNDPGHGWRDVAGPLPGDSGRPGPYQLSGDSDIGVASNAGFVKNFANELENNQGTQAPHDESKIAAGESRTIFFRPIQPGLIGVRTVPTPVPTRSETGHLGELVLLRPGGDTPLATSTARIGSTFITLSYHATAADLAFAGDWTCEVTNDADIEVNFTTDITNAVGRPDPSTQEPIDAVMGYYNADQLPAYDFLAKEFAICQRWFASVPTDTWPNRLYALTGGSGGLIQTPSASDVVNNPPDFTLKTIFEVLQDHAVDWMIFFSDLPYALIFAPLAQDARYTARMRSLLALEELAQTGDLPAVSWIDPNFTDVPDGNQKDDDHPPGDVTGGQQLVVRIYNALSSSPAWSKTLFVITYDEHGGFYDHVRPPGTPPGNDGPPDDDPNFRRYGVRVPAFVVSPWVERGYVSQEIYDHTSLLRTILLRFCVSSRVIAAREASAGVLGPGGGIGVGPSRVPSMGARTDNANHIGPLLSAETQRAAVPKAPPITPAASAARRGPALTGPGAALRTALLGF